MPPGLSNRFDPRTHPPERILAGLVAVLAGIAVFLVASGVFPYHSSNHDEAVYLMQAELLLEGQLQLFPGAFGDAVRPWFFVDAGDRFYPKYPPLPAAFYALAMAIFGEPRVTLAAVAAGNTALVYVLGAMIFDRKVGLVAAVAFALSPMALVTSSVFLPYAPTTSFTLAFTVLYFRTQRSRRALHAGLAGIAIGVAFFMRPFTAVLFAMPFVAHALWELLATIRGTAAADVLESRSLPDPVRTHSVTAAVGMVFVCITLGYNAYLTGSPLFFPFEAFAPLDGPGFGHREIVGHSLEYTPELALETNAQVVWYLLTRWVVAGALGTVLAGIGIAATVRQWGTSNADSTFAALLAGLFVTVPLGNVLFWGNYNILATASDPTDGLLGLFGPFYHFDLLAPVAIFAAAGIVALWRLASHWLGNRDRVSDQQATSLGLAILIALLLVTAGTSAALVSGPVERNLAHTETYEHAYEPFEETSIDRGLVFVPTPYGEWLHHPFQVLRNDPGLDGSVVYALDRGPRENFAVVDAAPDRQFYRYTYRGEWTPWPEDRDVEPLLTKLSVREGEPLNGSTTVGVPERVEHATVRVETGAGYTDHVVSGPRDAITVGWTLDSDGLVLESVDGEVVGERIETDTIDEVVVQVRMMQAVGGTLTYRHSTAVRPTGDTVEVLWPPERTVCPLVDDCGREGTYLPDRQRWEGVSFETELEG